MFLVIICRNNGVDNRKYWNLRKEVIPMAGRKPKPTAMKKLEGNPGKRKLNTKEPVPAKGMPVCLD